MADVKMEKPAAAKIVPGDKKKKANHLSKHVVKYVIDCTTPVDDGIFLIDNFKTFLIERIKMDGKLNNKDLFTVTTDQSEMKIIVTPKGKMSKRYLKYLTKKYLKRSNLRDWLRVIAKKKYSYKLQYFSVNMDKDVNEEAAES
ncbi:hypothetical protein SNEBB_002604 [Seison nebaliae]|nr:hypothetical protein SNEBB_002604 [Seison nebaliae]